MWPRGSLLLCLAGSVPVFCFQVLLLQMYVCERKLSFVWGKCSGRGPRVKWMCNVMRNCQIVSQSCCAVSHSHRPPLAVSERSCGFPSSALAVVRVFFKAILMELQCSLIAVSLYTYRLADDVECRFTCIFIVHICSLVKRMFRFVPIFLNWVVCFHTVEFRVVFWVQVPCPTCQLQTCSPVL